MISRSRDMTGIARHGRVDFPQETVRAVIVLRSQSSAKQPRTALQNEFRDRSGVVHGSANVSVYPGATETS